MDDKEKCYISRDEDDDQIWVWRKPLKGPWKPVDVCKEVVNFQRENRSLENTDSYLVDKFKEKFCITMCEKSIKCVHLPVKLLNNEDYKLFSNDKNRKR